MIEATARKHGLQAADLYGPSEVAQDLIKDVMDSSFISAETKDSYTTRLSELIQPANTETKDHPVKIDSSRSSEASVMSLGFAVITAASTLMLVMVELRSGVQSKLGLLKVGLWAPIAIALLATGVTVAAAYAVALYRRRKIRDTEIMLAAFEDEILSGSNSRRRQRPKDEPS